MRNECQGIAEGGIRILEAGIDSQEATLLLKELSAALSAITGNSGEASFDASDMANEKSVFVIAMIQDEPVGCGAIRRLDSRTAEIKRMYAKKSGSGIGTCILNYLRNKTIGFGYETLVLETRKVNTKAVAFYLKNGFHVTENYGKYAGQDEAVCFAQGIRVAERG